MSLKDNYLKCVDSVSYLDRELVDVEKCSIDGKNDLIWYCTQLQKSVIPDDVDRFENLTGLNRVRQRIDNELKLKTVEEITKDTECSSTPSPPVAKRWAKEMYRRAVRRCHPDIHKNTDDDYSSNLVDVFNTITEAHASVNYSKLMVGCSKVFVYPKVITQSQVNILQSEAKILKDKIETLKKTEGFVWINLPVEQRETFIVNYLKQMGIRFQNSDIVKEVIKRKRPDRKTGTRPSRFQNVKSKN